MMFGELMFFFWDTIHSQEMNINNRFRPSLHRLRSLIHRNHDKFGFSIFGQGNPGTKYPRDNFMYEINIIIIAFVILLLPFKPTLVHLMQTGSNKSPGSAFWRSRIMGAPWSSKRSKRARSKSNRHESIGTIQSPPWHYPLCSLIIL